MTPIKTLGLCFLGVTLVFSGCEQVEKPAAPSPPDVTVALPVQKEVVTYADFTGTMEASERVEIRARVQGLLEKVNIPKKEGTRETWAVDEDEVLFEIERAPFEATLAAAEAQKQQTVAKLNLARATEQRYRQLVESKTVSAEEYQTKVAEYYVAKAAQAADEAAIDQANIDLGYTTIKSPIRGQASRNLVDAGNLVGAGQKTLLTTVVKMDPMYVYFDVSEPVVLKLLEWRRENPDGDGDPTVYIGLKGEEGCPHKGELDYIDNEVDPTTGTAMVRGMFLNKNAYLFPGLFVRIRVPLDPIPNALLVEEQAIETDLGGKYLLVVGKDDLVEQHRVELGPLQGGMRVITKGLAATDRYIVKGRQRAQPGFRVTPQTQTPQTQKPQTQKDAQPPAEPDVDSAAEGASATEGDASEPPAA